MARRTLLSLLCVVWAGVHPQRESALLVLEWPKPYLIYVHNVALTIELSLEALTMIWSSSGGGEHAGE